MLGPRKAVRPFGSYYGIVAAGTSDRAPAEWSSGRVVHLTVPAYLGASADYRRQSELVSRQSLSMNQQKQGYYSCARPSAAADSGRPAPRLVMVGTGIHFQGTGERSLCLIRVMAGVIDTIMGMSGPMCRIGQNIIHLSDAALFPAAPLLRCHLAADTGTAA
jgi:hypothetical protein